MTSKVRHWTPLVYFSLPQKEKNIGLVILNQSLYKSHEKFTTLWKIAAVTICVDGGANRLYAISKEHKSDEWLPQFITGDFDSIKPNVLDYYRQKGVKIVPTPAQDETDFTKAIQYFTTNCCHDNKVETIFILAKHSGRLDHTIGNLNTLFKAVKITDKPIILLSNDSISFLLQPGKHTIDVNTGLEGATCGLLPVGCKCESVTTKGLKWNLTNDALQFGELVSTSNGFDGSGFVEVETSHPLLWTMEVI